MDNSDRGFLNALHDIIKPIHDLAPFLNDSEQALDIRFELDAFSAAQSRVVRIILLLERLEIFLCRRELRF